MEEFVLKWKEIVKAKVGRFYAALANFSMSARSAFESNVSLERQFKVISAKSLQLSIALRVNCQKYPLLYLFLGLFCMFSALPVCFYVVFALSTVLTTFVVSFLVISTFLLGGGLLLAGYLLGSGFAAGICVSLALMGFSLWGTLSVGVEKLRESLCLYDEALLPEVLSVPLTEKDLHELMLSNSVIEREMMVSSLHERQTTTVTASEE